MASATETYVYIEEDKPLAQGNIVHFHGIPIIFYTLRSIKIDIRIDKPRKD